MANAKAEVVEAKNQGVICNKAGKIAGDITRQLYLIKNEIEKQLVKIKESTCQITDQALKKGKLMAKDSPMICKKVEGRWDLWRKQQELNICKTKLGAEIVRLTKEGVQDILQQSKVKELLKKVQGIEEDIQKIRKKMETALPKKRKSSGKSVEKPA